MTELFHPVIRNFYNGEKTEENYFETGKTFPKKGQEVSEERLRELSTTSNKLKRPFIKLNKDFKFTTAANDGEEKDEEIVKQTVKENPDDDQVNEVVDDQEPDAIKDIEELKVDELKALLDEKEIEYKASANKKELIQLVEANK